MSGYERPIMENDEFCCSDPTCSTYPAIRLDQTGWHLPYPDLICPVCKREHVSTTITPIMAERLKKKLARQARKQGKKP